MADEPAPVEVAASALQAPEAAPIVEAGPVVAPAVEAPAETSAVAQVVAPEAAPAAAVVEAKPAEAAPVTPPAAEPVVETAPILPTYEPFKLPEGIQAAPEQLEAAGALFGKYGLTQEAGQELVDFHSATIKQAQDAMLQRQIDTFAETRAGWVKDFEKQAGNRRDTILNDAKWTINDVVKDAKQRTAVFDALAMTGAGDHPAIINAFAAVAKRLREGAGPPQGLPPKGQPTSPADRRYGQRAGR